MIDTRTMAKARIECALAGVESAQKAVLQASAEVSPITGMAREHIELSEIYHNLLKIWHQIDQAKHKDYIDLDSLTRQKLLNQEAR